MATILKIMNNAGDLDTPPSRRRRSEIRERNLKKHCDEYSECSEYKECARRGEGRMFYLLSSIF